MATNTTAVNATAPAAGTEDRKRDGWRGTGSWGQWDDSDTGEPIDLGATASPRSNLRQGCCWLIRPVCWCCGCKLAPDQMQGHALSLLSLCTHAVSDGSDPTNCARHKSDGSWDTSGCEGDGSSNGGDGNGKSRCISM